LQQSRAAVTGSAGGSLATFAFPEQGNMAGDDAVKDEEEEEEDLYS
jgi:transitional endoplasmic reticulum ATPase